MTSDQLFRPCLGDLLMRHPSDGVWRVTAITELGNGKKLWHITSPTNGMKRKLDAVDLDDQQRGRPVWQPVSTTLSTQGAAMTEEQHQGPRPNLGDIIAWCYGIDGGRLSPVRYEITGILSGQDGTPTRYLADSLDLEDPDEHEFPAARLDNNEAEGHWVIVEEA